MSRIFVKLAQSVRKRWLGVVFRIATPRGRVSKTGRLRLHVPLRCDGVGRVTLGAGIIVGYGPAPILGDGAVRLQARAASARISVGESTFFSNNVQVIAEQEVTIGARCLLGDAVLILDSDFHNLSAEGRHRLPGVTAPVVIEDNVLVGSRTIILKGVTIGRDSVIGAGSLVARSIPPGVVAAGNPAKIIRPL